jgi:regulator of ribonuclease activity A
MAIGIKAIASHPRKSGKQGTGVRGVALDIEGRRLEPGAYAYADADGIVVSDRPLT